MGRPRSRKKIPRKNSTSSVANAAGSSHTVSRFQDPKLQHSPTVSMERNQDIDERTDNCKAAVQPNSSNSKAKKKETKMMSLTTASVPGPSRPRGSKAVPSTSTSKSRQRYTNSLGKPIKYLTISFTKEEVLKRMVRPVRLLLPDIAILGAHEPADNVECDFKIGNNQSTRPAPPGQISNELPGTSRTNITTTIKVGPTAQVKVLSTPDSELIEDKGDTVLNEPAAKRKLKPTVGPKSRIEKIRKIEAAPVKTETTAIVKRKQMVGPKSKVAKLMSTKVEEATINRKVKVGPKSKVKKVKLDESQEVNVTDHDEEVDVGDSKESETNALSVANGNEQFKCTRKEQNYEAQEEEEQPAEPIFLNLGNDIRKGLEGNALAKAMPSISKDKGVQ